MQNKLEQIDNLLSLIQVSGDSTFTLVKARSLLKEVYDELCIQVDQAQCKKEE